MNRCCRIDVSSLDSHPGYAELSFIGRAVFRELADYVARTGSEQAPEDIVALARAIESTPEAAQSWVRHFERELACPLIERIEDLASGVVYWRVPVLADSLAKQANIERLDRKLKNREIKNNKRTGRQFLTKRLTEHTREAPAAGSARIRYLTHKEYWQAQQETARFSGWLPTAQFASTHQAYIVDADVRRQWQEQFPQLDIEECLDILWRRLMRTPQARPGVATMSAWVRDQLQRLEQRAERCLARGFASTDAGIVAIEAAIDELLAKRHTASH